MHCRNFLLLAVWGFSQPAAADTRSDCTQTFNCQLRISSCTAIIRNDSRAAWAYNNRGMGFEKTGDYGRAIADYTTATNFQPTAGRLANRGNAYRLERKYDLAFADFNRAIQLDPRFGDAYYNRAIAYEETGQIPRAIDDFRFVVQLNPRDEDARSQVRRLGGTP
jgi:tetratricopeptide (TPR) repeat protein